jgi:shikimate 5-dehydrogenase
MAHVALCPLDDPFAAMDAVLGLDLRYDLWDLDTLGAAPSDVGDLLRKAEDAGYRGLNITHPCKQAVIPLLQLSFYE